MELPTRLITQVVDLPASFPKFRIVFPVFNPNTFS